MSYTGPMIVDVSAKRSRRHLANNANGKYAALKREARRRERRNNRINQFDDGDYYIPAPTRRLTGWQIS